MLERHIGQKMDIGDHKIGVIVNFPTRSYLKGRTNILLTSCTYTIKLILP